MKTLILILAFAFAAFAQSDLPDKADINDIRGMTKVYVDVTDPTNAFKDAFDKAKLVSVSKAADAEFFIEYRMTSRGNVGSLNIPTETGVMTVYYYKEKTKVVVWQDSAQDSGKHPSPDDKLLKRFLKERARADKAPK